jgi:hypothetical protein
VRQQKGLEIVGDFHKAIKDISHGQTDLQLHCHFVDSPTGAQGSVVVKALCYKPEGCRFETRWGEFSQFT